MNEQTKQAYLRLAWAIIAVVSTLTVFFLIQASRVDFSGSVSDLIIVDSKDAEFMKRVNESRVNSEQLVVMVKGENMLSARSLADLALITGKFEGLECLASATSLTNMKIPKAQPISNTSAEVKEKSGICYSLARAEKTYLKARSKLPTELIFMKGQRPKFPEVDSGDMRKSLYYIDNFSLWETLPESDNEIRHFKEDIQNDVYQRNFVSPDGSSCAILLNVKDEWLKNLTALVEVQRVIAELSGSFGAKYRIVLAGNINLQHEMKNNIALDTVSFIKIGIVLVILSYWMAYRTIRGILLPSIALLISEIWVLGIMGLLGYDLNIVLYIVPVFVLAVGSSATIHVISHFYSNFGNGLDRIEASVKSVKELTTPILSSSATTAFGFAALMISNVKGLNVFVILTVSGLCIITILSLLFIPSLMIVGPDPRKRINKSFVAEEKWKPFIEAITKRSRIIRIFFILLSFTAFLGIFMIDTDNDLTKLLEEDSQVLQVSREVSDNLAGTTLMTLVLESVPGWAVKKDFLERLSLLQKKIEESPNIDKTTSLADIFKLTNYISGMGMPGRRGNLPDFQYKINSHMQLFSSMEEVEGYKAFGKALRDLITNFASEDFSTAKILIRSNLTSLKKMNAEIERIEDLTAKCLGPHIQPRIIGGIVDVNKAVAKILYGQTQGVIMALITIFILMLIQFVSLKIAMICLIPNIFPIVFFYGSLGLFKIGLDLSSGLVACVAIGIAVDDTIHFMTELKRQLKKTYNGTHAIIEAEKHVGSPILLTKIILAILFGILIFSRFPVMSNLGWLQAGTMMACLLCNLIMLPAVLSGIRLLNVWDIVKGFKFDPRKAPVFKGMSAFSIKVFLSMGKIEEFKAGDVIIQPGAPGEAMFIIIEGKVKISYIDDFSDSQRNFELSTGHVFGELAVLSRTERRSTAEALTDLKVVTITKDFYENAEAFHPRICNRFLVNVIENLSMRLMCTQAPVRGARTDE